MHHWFEDPVVHILILLAVCAWRPRRALRAALIAYILVIGLSPLPLWLVWKMENVYRPPAPPAKKTAAVVLTGGTVRKYKNFDQYEWGPSAARVTEAIRLYRRGLVSKIIISGTEKDPELLAREVDSDGELAAEWGVDRGDIILEDRAPTTAENGKFSARILREKNIDDFYLVTSAIHLPRAMAVFRKLGLQPTPYPVDRFISAPGWTAFLAPSPGWRMIATRSFFHEIIGFIWYQIRGVI